MGFSMRIYFVYVYLAVQSLIVLSAIFKYQESKSVNAEFTHLGKIYFDMYDIFNFMKIKIYKKLWYLKLKYNSLKNTYNNNYIIITYNYQT